MTPADDTWHGWNGRALDQLDERVKALEPVPVILARMEGKLDAMQQRRWSPSAKSGLAAAFVLAGAPILSLLAVSH